MPLADIEILIDDAPLPKEVAGFLEDANARVSQFLQEEPVQSWGFVPCDFATVYRAMRFIADRQLASGKAFCEWGSGFGVVAGVRQVIVPAHDLPPEKGQ